MNVAATIKKSMSQVPRMTSDPDSARVQRFWFAPALNSATQHQSR
jgi:hypothetical protein